MERELPKIKATISSHKHRVRTVCFSPDQTKLCSAGDDKRMILTNLQNNEAEKEFTGHKQTIWGSDFSSDGKLVASASSDRTVRIWRVKSENGISTILKGHYSLVYCVQFFHNDATKVISGSEDRTIKIWSIERKKKIFTLKCDGGVSCVDILSDNNTIVCGTGKLRIWDYRRGKCVKIFDDLRYKGFVTSVQFYPNSFSLASGSDDKTIKIYDFRTFKLLQNYEEHSDCVYSLHFHPSEKYLVSGSGDDTIKLFDLPKKKVVFTLNDHSDSVESVQFSPDGKYFASGSFDKKVFIWNFPLDGRMILQKEIDEVERVKYLAEKDLFLLFDVEDGVFRSERNQSNVLKIRIDNFCRVSFFCYKSFLL